MKQFKPYIRLIRSHKEKLIKVSNTIWNYAEPSFQEKKSSEILANFIENIGFNVERGVAEIPTAFAAEYGKEPPVIAVLGEYDALPGLSQSAKPFKQATLEGGAGHGCGHNLLATACLGAIIAVKEAIKDNRVRGTIKYFGCPAEEVFNTKGYMINPGGIFKDVDIALCWHPASINAVRLSSNSAINTFKFKFIGKTAHAAADPQLGRGALDAVELTNIATNYLREHIISDAKVHYVISNGGNLPNVVPDEAEVYYSIRCPKRHQVEEIHERLLKIARGAELMTETTLKFEFLDATYNHIRNKVVSEVLQDALTQIGPPRFNSKEQEFAKEIQKTFSSKYIERITKNIPENLLELAKKVLKEPLFPIIAPPMGEGQVDVGCTDVGDVSWNVPLGEFRMVCFPNGCPGHSWQTAAVSGMTIGHKGMLNAAKVIALAALKFMDNQELIVNAKKEHIQNLDGKSYKSPFPSGFKPPIDKVDYLIVR